MAREFRFHLWAALGYFVVLEALLVGAILFWPSFEENLDSLRSMAPMQALKDIVDTIGKGGVSAYVNGQHYFKGCNTVGSLAAVVFAMGAVAGEAQRGTLEMWLARPLTRRRILLERWISGLLATALPVFATSLTVPWLLSLVHEEMPLDTLMLSSLHECLLLAAIYSLTFLYSCLSSRPIQIAFVMLLLTIFEFSMYMIKDVTHWSIFRLTDVEVFARIGAGGTLDWRICVPLVLVSASSLFFAQVAFARRVP